MINNSIPNNLRPTLIIFSPCFLLFTGFVALVVAPVTDESECFSVYIFGSIFIIMAYYILAKPKTLYNYALKEVKQNNNMLFIRLCFILLLIICLIDPLINVIQDPKFYNNIHTISKYYIITICLALLTYYVFFKSDQLTTMLKTLKVIGNIIIVSCIISIPKVCYHNIGNFPNDIFYHDLHIRNLDFGSSFILLILFILGLLCISFGNGKQLKFNSNN